MKKTVLFIGALLSLMISNAQVSTFDDLNLPKIDTFWNGSDQTGNFTSGVASFENNFAGFFSNSFGYSNMTDVTTPGFMNQYSAYTGVGYDNSENYALANTFSGIKVTFQESRNLSGTYVTNATYSALSMLNGDNFAKKFGGASGNDEDWFKLTVEGFSSGNSSGTTEFYLADFRFSDNTEDYIVDSWSWFDLSSLGSVDSIEFTLSSSDVGGFGMNTPAYFCLDDFTVDIINGVNTSRASNKFTFYPNPASNQVTIKSIGETQVSVTTMSGLILKEGTLNDNGSLDISDLNTGVYLIQMESNGELITDKLVKQ